MRVYTLQCQLEWAQKCLRLMMQKGSASGDVALQECIVYTLEQRIKEKYGDE